MKKVLKILEFDKILDKLQEYTDSEQVKKRIYKLEPTSDINEAKERQRETTESSSTLLKLGNMPVSLSVSDMRNSVKRAEQGGVLSPRELLEIAKVLYVARRTKSYLGEISEECEMLAALRDKLLTAKALEDRINSCIVSETEIADDASSELSAIRRRMKNLNGKIKETYFYKFNEKAILRTDAKTQSEVLKNYTQGGIYTSNEARQKLDLPNAEGGDVLLVNGSYVPIQEAGAAYNGGIKDGNTKN